MKIIALQGKGNTGKSTTLRGLLQKLNGDSNFKLIAAKKPSLQICITQDKDVWALFEYLPNGKIVALTTHGDNDTCISRDYIDMKKEINNTEFDVFVCAAHMYGGTVDYVLSLGDIQNVYFLLTFGF